MNRQRLDLVLLGKIKKRTNKSYKYLREQIAKKAGRAGISSEAYQVIWAKQLGIGTATFQRKLTPAIQIEIREALPTIFAYVSSPPKNKGKGSRKLSQPSPILLAIEYLIQDAELRRRCKDLLMASGKYDRAFREATTVLEDRIKKLSGIRNKFGASLVSTVISSNLSKAILRVSDEANVQEGFHSICRGIMLSFRDTTHHNLSDEFKREDALKFCGFVDSILAILDKAQKQGVP